MTQQILQFLKDNYILIISLFTFIEVLLRIIPTYKDVSILSFIRLIMSALHEFIDALIPNKVKEK